MSRVSRGHELPPPLAWRGTFILFAGAAILAFFVADIVLPQWASRTRIEPVVLWQLAAGLILCPALLLIGWVLLRSEGWSLGRKLWHDRLRFRPMTAADWLWSLGAIVGIGAASAVLFGGLLHLRPEVSIAPWFLEMQPLSGRRLWILAAWLPVFVLTLFSEEIVWRGVVLPRQEAALGRWAWIANGAGWLVFHLAFGPAILITLLPIVAILPWVVQRRRNSWVGVVVHAAFNGPGFLATAFGWI